MDWLTDTHAEHPATLGWQAQIDAGRLGAPPALDPALAANRDRTAAPFARLAGRARRCARARVREGGANFANFGGSRVREGGGTFGTFSARRSREKGDHRGLCARADRANLGQAGEQRRRAPV